MRALLTGTPMRARRPAHFFRANGTLPEEVELTLKLPPHVEEPEQLLAELERRIAEVEAEHELKRRESGRCVLGRRRVLRQPWRGCPETFEPRRILGPRVATKDKWARIATLQRNKQFERDYDDAQRARKADLPTVFPYGTY